VSIRESRKSRAETPPIVSTIRRTQRRPVKAAKLHGLPLRMNATELPGRRFLHLAAGAAALPPVSRVARAQTYPTRPVRIIIGYTAGGPADIVARLIGQWLSKRLGQQVIIENRPGAGGNIGTEAVARAPPDGYTLLLVNSTNAINATLYGNLNFKFVHDIAPVASIISAGSDDFLDDSRLARLARIMHDGEGSRDGCGEKRAIHAEHVLLRSTLCRLINCIGLERVAKDISVPSLQEYLEHRAKAAE
jgi:hypothetical protein